jgi:hypothetical protein
LRKCGSSRRRGENQLGFVPKAERAPACCRAHARLAVQPDPPQPFWTLRFEVLAEERRSAFRHITGDLGLTFGDGESDEFYRVTETSERVLSEGAALNARRLGQTRRH